MPIPQASPTEYNGLIFRSRLEARYAALLDLCGNRWEYEPYEFGGYIPDFLLIAPNGTETYLEIKPGRTTEQLMPAMLKAREYGFADPEIFAVVGDGPRVIEHPFNEASGLYWEHDDLPVHAALAICSTCSQLGWISLEMSYHIRPCGHRDRTAGGFNEVKLNKLWRTAQNTTRWLPKRK